MTSTARKNAPTLLQLKNTKYFKYPSSTLKSQSSFELSNYIERHASNRYKNVTRNNVIISYNTYEPFKR